jgi:hypothetical protein
MLKKVLSFEESSALSETAVVGGGVEMDGMETAELAVEGAGDARSIVEPEEAYAMVDQVGDSRQSKERRRLCGHRRQEDARERLSRGRSPLRVIFVRLARVGSSLADHG